MSLDFGLVYDNDGNEIEVFGQNITHNLAVMAEECDLYNTLWHPEVRDFVYARDIIHPLEQGLVRLEKDPDHFKKFNSSNGWGLYKHFVPFVAAILAACKKYPSARIKVWH